MLKKVNALFKLNMLVKNVCIKLECISQVATLLLFYFFMQFFWHFQALSSLADCAFSTNLKPPFCQNTSSTLDIGEW
jgi:hypothetical protein